MTYRDRATRRPSLGIQHRSLLDTKRRTRCQAVPVPPASASAVITGSAEAPAANAETPVAPDARPDASTGASAFPDTSTASSAGSDASASSDESKAATESPATNPLGTLTRDDEVKSLPLAGQGNNHSSPSLEQGEKK